MQYLSFHMPKGDTGLDVIPTVSYSNIVICFAAASCHENVHQRSPSPLPNSVL